MHSRVYATQLLFLLAAITAPAINLQAQSIIYAPESAAAKALSGFEVVGKSGGYYVVSSITSGKEKLSFYDAQMKQQQQVVIGVDRKRYRLVGFSAGARGVHVITSTTSKKHHYISRSFVSNSSFSITAPMVIDSFPAANDEAGSFHLIRSKSGNQAALFKVHQSARSKLLLLDILFIETNTFETRKVRLNFPSFAAQHKVESLELADNGNFYFVVSGRERDAGFIQQVGFYELAAGSTAIRHIQVPVSDFFPERIQLFINNRQQTCTLFSFASEQRKGNIDGIFTAAIKMGDEATVKTSIYRFTAPQRQEANGRVSADIALNDFYITDAVSKADGGLIVLAECMYTAARETNINRWERPLPDGWFNTTATPLNFSEQAQSKTIAYGGMGNNGGSTAALNANSQGENFFNTENILVLDLDAQAQATAVRFIQKRQQSNVAYELSYAVLKRTDGLFLFYNDWEFNAGRILRALQVESAISMELLPVVRGLLPGYVLLNRMAAQVSNNELIIPAVRGNRFVFSLLRF